MNNRLAILCVLRSGGDYTPDYVANLKKGLDRAIGHRDDWELYCLTDLNINISGVTCIKLDLNLPGWWSKIELFRVSGPCLFFDLDTLIIKDISLLCDAVLSMPENDFIMLRPFSHVEYWASGIMGWNGDFSFIFSEFKKEDMSLVRGDQEHIAKAIDLKKIYSISAVQDNITGVYSYKRHCKGTLPSNATIVCFHGKPRPHQMLWLRWVRRHWTGE